MRQPVLLGGMNNGRLALPCPFGYFENAPAEIFVKAEAIACSVAHAESGNLFPRSAQIKEIGRLFNQAFSLRDLVSGLAFRTIKVELVIELPIRPLLGFLLNDRGPTFPARLPLLVQPGASFLGFRLVFIAFIDQLSCAAWPLTQQNAT